MIVFSKDKIDEFEMLCREVQKFLYANGMYPYVKVTIDLEAIEVNEVILGLPSNVEKEIYGKSP